MQLTVKQLKTILETIPDHAFVMMGDHAQSVFPDGIEILDNGTHPSITFIYEEMFPDIE